MNGVGRRLRALMLGGLLWAGHADAVALRVCAAEQPPFTLSGAGSRSGGGFHAATVTRIMADLGYSITIHVVAWERCLRDLADGYYAAAFSAEYQQERDAYAVYPALPLDTLNFVAVVRRGEGAGWNAERRMSMLPQPVGVAKGWAFADEVAATPGVVIDDGGQSMEQNLRKLLAGRIGSAVMEVRTARELLARLDPGGQLTILDEAVVDRRKVYMVFGRKALGNWSARKLADGFALRLKTPAAGAP